MENIIEFQQARDFSKKINVTFEFIKQNFKPLFKSILFIAGPPMLVGSVLAGGLYSDYFGWVGEISKNPAAADSFGDGIFSPTLWRKLRLPCYSCLPVES